jgi:outer membrane biosynthesis protein TonB
MSFLDTKHKRKSATWTTIIGIIILFLIFNFGLRFFDPPKEYGISVNFGTSNVGSGDVQPTEALKPATQETEVEPVEEEVEEVEEVIEEPIVEEQVATSTPTSDAAEEVITQENEEALAIKKQKEENRQKEIREQQEADKKAAEEREKIEAENRRIAKEKQEKIDAENRRIEKERQEKANKKKNIDALLGGIGNTDGKADGGEGNDDQAGDKGKVTGDPNASGYYGNSGSGSGGNYQLGNRKAVDMPKPTYECNEEGRVFVSISVDQSGNVIKATAGVKGTTNSAACLLQRAKEAALKTKFNSDSKAPAKQVGTIIYNFSLSK